jgi:hypothetical protein
MSQIVVECPIWKAILADERLAAARRKLSFHEIRLIIGHAIASGIEAPSGVETGNTDSTVGESPVGEAETPKGGDL